MRTWFSEAGEEQPAPLGTACRGSREANHCGPHTEVPPSRAAQTSARHQRGPGCAVPPGGSLSGHGRAVSSLQLEPPPAWLCPVSASGLGAGISAGPELLTPTSSPWVKPPHRPRKADGHLTVSTPGNPEARRGPSLPAAFTDGIFLTSPSSTGVKGHGVPFPRSEPRSGSNTA